MVDSPLAIHQQGEDTARIAECLAGLLCSWIALTISSGRTGNRSSRGRCPRSGVGRVYPRACGGTRATLSISGLGWGLSPRVRGSRTSITSPRTSLGSIPARAGEPPLRAIEDRPIAVYPRVCGGAGQLIAAELSEKGLSPRVRGNPGAVREDALCGRSIPARAGESSGLQPLAAR